MGKVKLAGIINISLRLIFGSIFLMPLSLQNYDFSHQEGLSLKYSRNAPPLAIFDDERISLLTEDNEISTSKVQKEILLATHLQKTKQRNSPSIKMAQNISHKFEQLQKTAFKTAPEKKEIRYLAGLSLKRNSSSVAIIKKTITIPTRKLDLHITKTASVTPAHVDAVGFANSLSPRLKDRVEEIENFDEILGQDYGTESFEARAKSVLANAGVSPDAPSDFEIANTRGTGVGSLRKTYSQRMQDVDKRAVNKNSLARNYGNSGYRKGNKATEAPSIKKDIANQDSIEQKDDKETTIASRGFDSNPIRQALISGPIEMTKGLAITSAQQLTVYRQIGGTRYGYGQVMLNEGRYEIFVDDLSSGVVIAELLDHGSMIGRAEILIPEVMLNAKSPKDLKNIPIKLEPVLDKVEAENISAYSYLKKEKIKDSEIKIGDMIGSSTKIFNSSIVMKASRENYWGNIIVGSSKQLFTQILNPDATIQALKDILGIKTPKELMGLIKGDVTIAGTHVSGAQVEIIGEEELLKPVYFNSFIPDTSLNETSTNGQYAFVDVPQGSYLVRAKYKGKYLSPHVAPVEPGYVTQVQFDVQKPSLSEAFVFDIQTSEMMSAQIGFLGSDKKVPIQARKLISFSGDEGIQFLEVQTADQNYFTTRVTVDKSEKEILIPMISQKWLSGLLMRMKVNSIPDTGLIIGTALALPYSVELDPRAYNEDTKVIYFDSSGQVAHGATATPAGGGFVAINVNPGIRSVFNKYQGTKNLKITTMAVDSGAINVFNSKF